MQKKSKKSRKRRIAHVISTVIVFVILLSSMCLLEWGVLTNTRILSGDKKKISGEWTYNVDITDEAATAVAMWLSSIQGSGLTANDVYDELGTQSIKVTCIFDSNTYSYSQTISDDDYDRCVENVYEATANILERLTMERIEYADIDLESTGISLSELIVETLGYDTITFLHNQAPELIPDKAVFEEKYCDSGRFSLDIKNGEILFVSDLGTEPRTMTYMLNQDKLIVSENEEDIYIYNRGANNE